MKTPTETEIYKFNFLREIPITRHRLVRPAFIYIRGSENDITDINKKSSMYVIERGIPAPCNRNVGRWATIVSEMNDGDSVVVADLKETHSMRSAIVRNGKRSSVQQLPDGNFRVWKLPKR